MTIEHAFYYKLMLICGYSDELYEYIEKALNEQATYEEVLVDLAFCGYNEKQMLSVLESYVRQKKEKVDYDVIIESIFNFLQNKYLDSETSVEALVKLMYRIGQLSDLNEERTEPWFTMMIFDTLYEDAEEGYIKEEVSQKLYNLKGVTKENNKSYYILFVNGGHNYCEENEITSLASWMDEGKTIYLCDKPKENEHTIFNVIKNIY